MLSTSDITGGAAIVSLRLVEALRSLGHDAMMLVVNRRGKESHYVKPLLPGYSNGTFQFYAERLEIFLNNGFNRRDLFKVSTASSGHYVSHLKEIREADAIMLGYVNQGFLSLREIDRLAASGKPVVWTMHDQWCMTGICHIAGRCDHFKHCCGDCPLLHWRKSPHDISWKIRKRKQVIYDRHKNLKFVAVSNWLASQASVSSLLGDRPVNIIPNAFLIPESPSLNTERRAPVILMGAARLDDDIKNLPLAIEALNRIYAKSEAGEVEKGVKVKFFGNIRDRSILDSLQMPFIELGEIDHSQIFEEMNHARVILSTSRFEMLPTTIIEGLAWGCVAVATCNGGQSDIIDNGVNGYLVDDTGHSVADGLTRALECDILPEHLRDSVREKYDPVNIASKYIQLILPES